MNNSSDWPKVQFATAISSMDDDEVARYCDAMGWTTDPLVNALVERLLDKMGAKEDARAAGWLQGLGRAAELVEAAVDEADGRDQVDVYILDDLLQDINRERSLECPDEVTDPSPEGPDVHQKFDGLRRQGTRGGRRGALRGKYQPVIVRILANATGPMRRADLVESVRMETGARESQLGGIYTAITALTNKRRIREHDERLSLA